MKTDDKIRNRTLRIAFTGVMCALTAVATAVGALTIPMPATEGYINFGDAIIMLTALFAGPVPALIVGGIGSMLADLICGYVHWAGFTLVIKGLEGLIAGLFAKTINKKGRYYIDFIGLILSALFMVLGYYLAGALMYGWAGSFSSLGGNFIQGGVSVAVSFVLYIVLDRIKAVRSFTEKLYKDATVSDEGKTADAAISEEKVDDVAADEGNDRTDVSDGCETEDKK